MIRHILLLNWKEELESEAVEDAVRTICGLKDLPCIARFHCAESIRLTSDAFDFVLLLDFEKEADWRAYEADPRHEAAAAAIRPLVAAKARIQFNL